jgi:hypothetical protein
MFKGLLAPIMIFILAMFATSILFGGFHVVWGSVDFFENHNIFFLIFISFFPRLTLLFSSVAFGGFLWWLGFFFMPRLLVAVLATVAYGKTNPLLVVIAWIVAISGEFMEKKKITNSKRFVFRTYRQPPPYEQPKATTIDKNGVIEAEFTRKD